MKKTKFLAWILTVAMLVCMLPAQVFADTWDPNKDAAKQMKITDYINAVGSFTLNNVKEPTLGTNFGEWSVMSLARGSYTNCPYVEQIPDNYFEDYVERVMKVTEKENGILDINKSTEYSRVIMAFTAIGADPTNVAGYNFIEKLVSMKLMGQGINGPIWALIALDLGDYEFPSSVANAENNSREAIIDIILSKEIGKNPKTPSKLGFQGGWALYGKTPDPDITGMSLFSLAPYYSADDSKKEVIINKINDDKKGEERYIAIKCAVERGIKVLSTLQKKNGGYGSWGSINSESIVWAIVPLTAMGIDPKSDSVKLSTLNETVSFIKTGDTVDGTYTNNMVDALLTFWDKPTGGFKHVTAGYDGGGNSGNKVNDMASDQSFYGLIAYDRFVKGLNPLFDMTDVEKVSSTLTFDVNGVALEQIPEPMKVSAMGQRVTLPEITTSAGIYNWSTLSGGKGTIYKAGSIFNMGRADKTLYAFFDIKDTLAKEIELINTSKAAIRLSIDGNDVSKNVYWVQKGAMDTLDVAILAAKSILEKADVSDAECREAHSTLRNAIADFAAVKQVGLKEKVLTGITITKAPDKVTYKEGETFDKTGMEVTAQYDDNTTEIVTDWRVDKTVLAKGDTKVIVTYKGQTAEQDIQVGNVSDFGLSSLVIYTRSMEPLLGAGDEKYPKQVIFEPTEHQYTLPTVADTGLKFEQPVKEGVTVKVVYGDKERELQPCFMANWVDCLKLGKNNFSVVVTSNDGKEGKYNFSINRYPGLMSLFVSDGTKKLDFDNNKRFDSNKREYEITVGRGTKSVKIDATKQDDSYVVTYNGTASSEVNIEGKDSIDVVVTHGEGQDALINQYTIKLKRIGDSGGSSSGGGSSGGGGGGTSEVTNPNTDNDAKINKNADEKPTATATAKIEAKTNKDGKAIAAVSEKDIISSLKQAVDAAKKEGKNTLAEVKVEVKAGKNTKTVEASLPTKAVKEVANAEKTQLTLATPVADLTFDQKALEAIGKDAEGSEVKVSAEVVATNEVSALKEIKELTRPVYDLKMVSNGKQITNFKGGEIWVSLPYTLSANEKAANVLIYYIDDNGNKTVINDVSYNSRERRVTFKTNHFSYYAVGYKEDPASTGTQFSDVKNKDWYAESIMTLVNKGIIKGKTATTFEPNSNITRAEFTQILYGMAKTMDSTISTDASSISGKFKDVKASDWYANAVAWASTQGVVAGVKNADGSMNFAPNAKITRQDMAVMIQNYQSKVAKKALTAINQEVSFADASAIAGYAKEAVTSMQKAGIISGVKQADGTYKFAPKNNATRAEAATMIAKLLKTK